MARLARGACAGRDASRESGAATGAAGTRTAAEISLVSPEPGHIFELQRQADARLRRDYPPRKGWARHQFGEEEATRAERKVVEKQYQEHSRQKEKQGVGA